MNKLLTIIEDFFLIAFYLSVFILGVDFFTYIKIPYQSYMFMFQHPAVVNALVVVALFGCVLSPVLLYKKTNIKVSVFICVLCFAFIVFVCGSYPRASITSIKVVTDNGEILYRMHDASHHCDWNLQDSRVFTVTNPSPEISTRDKCENCGRRLAEHYRRQFSVQEFEIINNRLDEDNQAIDMARVMN